MGRNTVQLSISFKYTKACHFSDYKTADKIKLSTDPYEAKLLSRNIENYDKDAWKLIAKEACLPGIKTKFEQNKMLLEFLKSYPTIAISRK